MKRLPLARAQSICAPLLILCVIFALLITPRAADAAGAFDPKLKWRAIRTGHFEVIYSQGLEDTARLAGAVAEDVHRDLSAKFGWTPRTRTRLVVTDNSDFANGLSTVFPYPDILIYVAPPSSDESLDNYDNWLHTLLTHEYTHILMMDMTGGIPGILRHVFGRSIEMNSIVPAWWGEGVPTWEETNETILGRGRSSYADMVMRAAILEDKFPSMGQAGEDIIKWPGGQTPYLFGVEFVKYLSNRFGDAKIAEFLKRYSRQIIPFFMNYTGNRVFNADLHVLWAEWERSLKAKYEAQREAVMAAGLVEGKAITSRGYGIRYPVWTPDSRGVIYYDYDPHESPAIRMIDTDSRRETRLFKAQALGGLALSADGKRLAYPRLVPYTGRRPARYYSYTDIYEREVKKSGEGSPAAIAASGGAYAEPPMTLTEYSTEKERRVTVDERASDPAYSPDGESMAYISRDVGGASLMLKKGNSKPEILWNPGPRVMLDTPKWSPDGSTIALSVHMDGGYRDIYIVDVATKIPTAITHDRSRDVDPAWSPDGRYLLFSSDRAGIPNLYAYDIQSKSFFMVTNVLSAAFQPAVSPDGKKIVYQGYSSRGFDLYLMPYDPTAWKSVSIDPEEPVAGQYRYRLPEPVSGEPRSYSPLSTLLPRYLIPAFNYDGVDYRFGLSTGGVDPLMEHSWGLSAQYGTASNFVSWGASYLNNMLTPSFTASFQQYAVTYGKILLSADDFNSNGTIEIPTELYYLDKYYFEERSEGSVGIQNLFYARGKPLRVGLAYSYEDRRNITSLSNAVFTSLLPNRGIFAGVSVTASLSSLRQYPYSISPEYGFYAAGGFELLDEALGSDFNQRIYTGDLRAYLPMPWLRHHVLALHAKGGIMDGDQLFQGAFRVGGTLGESVFTSTSATFLSLRGFKTNQFIGDRALVLSGEYRFPIAYPQRAPGLLPIFFQKIHGAVFADYGGAFDRKRRYPLLLDGVPVTDVYTGEPIIVEFKDQDQWNLGVGAELRLTGTLGWGILGPPLTGRIGFAQDIQGDGIGPVVYFDIGTPF